MQQPFAMAALTFFHSPNHKFPRRQPIAASRATTTTTTTMSTRRHTSPPPRAAENNKVEIIKSLESWASEKIVPLLKPINSCWQPCKYLPDPSKLDSIVQLRDRAAKLSDELLVVLVGDMITEEALPTYQTWINTLEGVRDKTSSSPGPWATWTRGWTAEEKRHGDLLKTYLYLSGRVDMLMIERTIQYLIGAGMDIGTENNPYLGFVYTSFQERATSVSHGNTARLAKEAGDPILARICGTIASDEKRHENAYCRIVEKLIQVDPNGAMVAIGDMMRKKITMPAHMMYDGRDPNLFRHFSLVAQRIGVYTANDYADILEHLIRVWKLEKIEGLNGEAKEAQEFVCGLSYRIRKLQEIVDERDKKLKRGNGLIKFSWIFDKELSC